MPIRRLALLLMTLTLALPLQASQALSRRRLLLSGTVPETIDFKIYRNRLTHKWQLQQHSNGQLKATIERENKSLQFVTISAP